METTPPPRKRSVIDMFLALVERGGNALPHPSTLFLMFAVGVVLLSGVAAWSGGPVESLQQARSEAERLGFRLDTVWEHELPGEMGGRAVLVYAAPGGQGR